MGKLLIDSSMEISNQEPRYFAALFDLFLFKLTKFHAESEECIFQQ